MNCSGLELESSRLQLLHGHDQTTARVAECNAITAGSTSQGRSSAPDVVSQACVGSRTRGCRARKRGTDVREGASLVSRRHSGASSAHLPGESEVTPYIYASRPRLPQGCIASPLKLPLLSILCSFVCALLSLPSPLVLLSIVRACHGRPSLQSGQRPGSPRHLAGERIFLSALFVTSKVRAHASSCYRAVVLTLHLQDLDDITSKKVYSMLCTGAFGKQDIGCMSVSSSMSLTLSLIHDPSRAT